MKFNEIIELGNSSRTEDVRSTISFQSLMISPAVITKMTNHGFKYPSPVQEKAIPAALSGLDLLVQAKSGTGKTLVFSVMAVENLNTRLPAIQRLLVAPTREIAIQIKDTIKKLQPVGCRTSVFVGGTPLSLDKQGLAKGTHIAIGTTGRICQLLQEGLMKLGHTELFVLDEADKLMDEDFQKDVNYIFSCLPPTRQVAVFSATYPRGLDDTLENYMKDPTLIRLNAEDVQLVGIKQYVTIVFQSSAIEVAINILNSISYTQALVFVSTYNECDPVCAKLQQSGFEAAYISSQMKQFEREKVIEQLKANKIKILVSTDLTARGVDASNVNLVINLGATVDAETYFHRIGRAARFGGQGAAVTLLEDGRAVAGFSANVNNGGIKVKLLDIKRIPQDLTTNEEHHVSCMDFLASKKTTQRPAAKIIAAKKLIATRPIKIFENAFDVDMSTARSYDRRDMMSLKENLPVISQDFTRRIHSLKVNNPNFSTEVDELTARIKAEKSALPAHEEKKPGEKKFKFVPSREKAKKKFYLRGELMAVKDSYTDDVWLQYAKTKFNFDEDPFILPEQKKELNLDALIESLLDHRPIETPPNSDPSENNASPPPSPSSRSSSEEVEVKTEINGDVVEEQKSVLNIPLRKPEYSYDRDAMITIQQSWRKEQWLQYVKENWNTDEDPFVLDSAMRCSYTERIQKQREKEKFERIKVMREREAALRESQHYASSRSFRRLTLEAETWEAFCDKAYKDYEEFQESKKEKQGPVVPIRDTPEVWKERVCFYSSWVNNFESNFVKDVQLSAGFKTDVEINTEHGLEENLEKLAISDCIYNKGDNVAVKQELWEVNGVSVKPGDANTKEECSDDENYLTSQEDVDEFEFAEEANKFKYEANMCENNMDENGCDDEDEFQEAEDTELTNDSEPQAECPAIGNGRVENWEGYRENVNDYPFAVIYDRYFSLMNAYCRS